MVRVGAIGVTTLVLISISFGFEFFTGKETHLLRRLNPFTNYRFLGVSRGTERFT